MVSPGGTPFFYTPSDKAASARRRHTSFSALSLATRVANDALWRLLRAARASAQSNLTISLGQESSPGASTGGAFQRKDWRRLCRPAQICDNCDLAPAAGAVEAGLQLGTGGKQAPSAQGLFRRRGGLSPGASLALRVVLVVALVAVAILGHWLDREGLRDNADGKVSLLDIVYFTVITVTTVGYGDIVPVSDGARMFDTFIVTPIRIFVWLIFLGTAYDFMLRHSWERWRMERMQKALRDHTIICGYGETGAEAAAELMREGYEPANIVIVDLLQERLDGAMARGMGVVLGDATSNAVLEAAGIDRAAAIIICPGRDDTAILTTLTARRLAPGIAASLTVRAAENEILARDAGATVIVNPVSFGGRVLAGSTRGVHVAEYLEDLVTARGKVKLRERMALPGETGVALKDIKTGMGLRLYRDGKSIGFWEPEARALSPGDQIVEIVSCEGEAQEPLAERPAADN